MAKCRECNDTKICSFCNGTGDDRGNNPIQALIMSIRLAEVVV